MTECSTDEYEITTKDPGAIAGTVIASVIIIAFIIAYLVFRFTVKHQDKSKSVTGQVYATLFDRLGGFFGSSIGQFSIGMLVAILISDVVSAFNNFIITPIIQVSIPDQNIFTRPIPMGRNVSLFPGSFLLSILGFILSLLVIFFIIEGFYQLTKIPKAGKILKYLIMVIIILVLLGLISWNIYDVSQNYEVKKCVSKDTPPAQALASDTTRFYPPINPVKMIVNPEGGVQFSM